MAAPYEVLRGRPISISVHLQVDAPTSPLADVSLSPPASPPLTAHGCVAPTAGGARDRYRRFLLWSVVYEAAPPFDSTFEACRKCRDLPHVLSFVRPMVSVGTDCASAPGSPGNHSPKPNVAPVEQYASPVAAHVVAPAPGAASVAGGAGAVDWVTRQVNAATVRQLLELDDVSACLHGAPLDDDTARNAASVSPRRTSSLAFPVVAYGELDTGARRARDFQVSIGCTAHTHGGRFFQLQVQCVTINERSEVVAAQTMLTPPLCLMTKLSRSSMHLDRLTVGFDGRVGEVPRPVPAAMQENAVNRKRDLTAMTAPAGDHLGIWHCAVMPDDTFLPAPKRICT